MEHVVPVLNATKRLPLRAFPKFFSFCTSVHISRQLTIFVAQLSFVFSAQDRITMVSIQSPIPFENQNPFDYEPQPPRMHSRVGLDITRRVMNNLDTLSTPTFDQWSNRPGSHLKTHYDSQSPLFHMALQRMRNGSGLQRLKEQRDAENARGDAALERLTSPEDKGLPVSHVNLGRQAADRRRSSLARSA